MAVSPWSAQLIAAVVSGTRQEKMKLTAELSVSLILKYKYSYVIRDLSLPVGAFRIWEMA
jgi:hypothetical protein